MWNIFKRKKKNIGPCKDAKSFCKYIVDNLNVPTIILVDELLLHAPNATKACMTDLVEITKMDLKGYKHASTAHQNQE